MLLTLYSALRELSIQHLNINFMKKNKFTYKESWMNGRAAPAITYQEYTQNESICLVITLDEHIARTER